MQPRFVLETVVSDFVAGVGNLPDRVVIFLARRVLSDDKISDV
jgi:hypothetical protein